MNRRWLLVAVVASVLVVSSLRQLHVGARALLDCDIALGKGELVEAIAFARAAAEAWLPGSPYPSGGYERLDRIASEAETRGDDAIATAAWRAMRAAASETRGLGVSTGAWRDKADQGLLRASTRATPVVDPARLGELLARDDSPSTFGLLALAAAACVAIAAAARLVRAPAKGSVTPGD